MALIDQPIGALPGDSYTNKYFDMPFHPLIELKSKGTDFNIVMFSNNSLCFLNF